MTQIRVHELASELNVSTHQVVLYLEDLGKKVRGPSTVLGVSAAAKVRGRFRSAKPLQVGDRITPPTVMAADGAAPRVDPLQADSGASHLDDHAAAHGPADSHRLPGTNGSAGTGGSVATQSLFLPPVQPATASSLPRSTGSFSNPFAVPTLVESAADRPASLPASFLPALKGLPRRVPPPQAAPQPAEPEPDFDALWESRGFAKADQQPWLEAGLRPNEAQLADRCQSAGIAPEELSRKLSGRTALQRLRDGEASTSVWARIREAEQQPRRAGTKLTGRFQLS